MHARKREKRLSVRPFEQDARDVDVEDEMTRHLLTGSSDRAANMVAFALEALDLLEAALQAAASQPH